jgi:ribosomal protein S18 acetylase RimI-like enzyme
MIKKKQEDTMEIRFAQPQDVGGILALLRQVGKLHHQIRPDAQKYGASQVLSMLNSTVSPIFVAAEDDKVLGYGFCRFVEYEKDPVISDHTELYIDDICVDETCRGKGVGTAIYDTICRYAKMRKCNKITLNVWCGNESAMKFYEKLGMKAQKITMERLLDACKE